MSNVINGKDDRVAHRVDERDPHDGMIPNITTVGRTCCTIIRRSAGKSARKSESNLKARVFRLGCVRNV